MKSIDWSNHHFSKLHEVISDFLISGKKDTVIIKNFCKSFLHPTPTIQFPKNCRAKIEYIKDKTICFEKEGSWDNIRTPIERGFEKNLHPRTVHKIKSDLWYIYQALQNKHE